MKTESGRRLRVLVVDDDPVIRRALRLILRSEPGVTVVGEAADGEDAVIQADQLRPDVVLMDLRMPRMDGLEATRRLKARNPDVMVVILSVYADGFDAARAAGASYLLLKDSPVETLLEALHSAPPVKGIDQ